MTKLNASSLDVLRIKFPEAYAALEKYCDGAFVGDMSYLLGDLYSLPSGGLALTTVCSGPHEINPTMFYSTKVGWWDREGPGDPPDNADEVEEEFEAGL